MSKTSNTFEKGQLETRFIMPTVHALERANLRGISLSMMRDTIRHGKKLHRQGYEFYVMLRKCISDEWNEKYVKRIVNTVVVVSSNGDIVTTYQNEKALKNIKKIIILSYFQ